MPQLRIIPRLDIKGSFVIKSVQLEGLRKVGDPAEFAKRYYEQGADELIFSDVVASLYGRNSLYDIVRQTAAEAFVPLTVGGGIRSTEDVSQMLRSGADKISLNSAALERPHLISELSAQFGSQAIVVEIQAKSRAGVKGWEALYDNGREHSNKDVVVWAQEAVELGAGEILLTSVDREGTRKGFDTDLIEVVSRATSVPVIVSGGLGQPEHMQQAVSHGADAIAVADMLHYQRASLPDIKKAAQELGLEVRT
ncbi:MAG: imidazole glycerol phosphate synthase subunit HisF [Dinoroseobacter sp.]|nr:imidazole glycerol phosphate synthase subunit HisF [Dinoroseobacter sp.]